MKAGSRLKRDMLWGIQCMMCGSEKTSVLVGKRTAYFRFYCGDCFYEFECIAKPYHGIEIVKGLIEVETN